MKRYLMFACAACLLAACEKPVFEDAGEDDDPSVVVPGDGEQTDEVLWTENDTARFYLQGVELSGVVLTDYPTPSVLIAHPLYRLPTRLEAAQVLKYAALPEGYWLSKQRIMCVDSQPGSYYTFVPHGTVTKAGMKTKYCVLPIRTERTSKKESVDITVNDEWE
jgi:hypothetical protein|nr:MAG TPA: Protein involved in gliding motility 9 Secretion System Type.5A [Caudoviricetes sp.]